MSFSNTDTHFSASTGLRSALVKTSRFVKMGAWQMRLQNRYGKLDLPKVKKMRLRLILGAHGSGADWLSRNLIQVEKGTPFFSNPLTRLQPNMVETDGSWNLPFEYMKETFGKHPMEHLFAHLVTLEDNNLLASSSNRLNAHSANFEQVLVHESHGLLMTEAIVRSFRNHTLLIVTDPVYCIDKAMAENSSETMANYLLEEFDAVSDPSFMLRFMGSKSKAFRKTHQQIRAMANTEEREFFKKVLALAAINQMFLKLSVLYPHVETLTLRDLILTPNLIYQLGIVGDEKVEHKGLALAPRNDFRPDISNITASMTGRTHRIDNETARKAYQLLAQAGLTEGRPMLDVGEKVHQANNKTFSTAVA